MTTSNPDQYGSTSGPRDGQPGAFQPISTPAPGAGAPTPTPPPASAPAPASAPGEADGWHPGRGAGNFDNKKGLLAAATPLAFIAFFAFGMMGGWAWSWIFFLVPSALAAFMRGSGRDC